MRGWMTRAGVALLAVTVLAACGDRRLTKLSTGITADSAAKVMTVDAPHRTLSYLTGGRIWEVRLYARDGQPAAADSIEWRKMSPVVLSDGKVVGWGWGFWDKTAAKLSIPVPPKK